MEGGMETGAKTIYWQKSFGIEKSFGFLKKWRMETVNSKLIPVNLSTIIHR